MNIHTRIEAALGEVSDDLSRLAEMSKIGEYNIGFHINTTAKAKGVLKMINGSSELTDNQKETYKRRLVTEFELCALDLN